MILFLIKRLEKMVLQLFEPKSCRMKL